MLTRWPTSSRAWLGRHSIAPCRCPHRPVSPSKEHGHELWDLDQKGALASYLLWFQKFASRTPFTTTYSPPATLTSRRYLSVALRLCGREVEWAVVKWKSSSKCQRLSDGSYLDSLHWRSLCLWMARSTNRGSDWSCRVANWTRALLDPHTEFRLSKEKSDR